MTKNQENQATQNLVKAIVEGMQEKKGANITILDLTSIENTITSFFVICSGDSNVHVDAIADSAEEYVREHVGEKPFHVEGKQNAQWILLDYLDVVVHVFQRSTREFYNLENLWADAERKDVPDLF
ncbi:ribosome silencing factor [Alkalitalea saponilacus]|uniref:Ribosomal silencing factor RsfS n=1 Tax=Alkalitalea saponilacus TaxID=889453 RepID=A0A1T5AHS7_9BACT|nr:ribosome silencing factor [Alkalitalea saponilacus]ASB48694.1 ribosome silencing factor [Alkalitalea saponilacus]SKB34541.1 ribosome-associated protein [Alkalitalea saponilacus]